MNYASSFFYKYFYTFTKTIQKNHVCQQNIGLQITYLKRYLIKHSTIIKLQINIHYIKFRSHTYQVKKKS